MTLLRASDHRRMPWANGGGTTYEIAIHPPDSSLADFDWRVSMADIGADGPFSVLPGIDRVLVLLSGPEMQLSIDDRVEHLRVGDAVRFSGEAAVSALLTEGPTRDLNVMARRGTYSADVSFVTASTVVTPPHGHAWTCAAPIIGAWSTEWGTAEVGDVVVVQGATQVSGSGLLAIISLQPC